MTKKDIEKKINTSGWASLSEKEKMIYNSELREVVYEEAIRCLGRDISPRENEYGCAESVNTLFVFALGEPIGGGTSTSLMYRTLRTDKRFLSVKEKDIKRGDIIISPSGYSKSTKVKCGHVGIVGDLTLDNERKIMSNSSRTSLWTQNYNLKSWKARWEKAGYPVKFFRAV